MAAQLQTLTSNLQAAQGEIDEAYDALVLHLLDALDPHQQEAILVWRRAGAHQVPHEFRVRDRTDKEWKRLARAARAELRSQVMDRPLAPAYSEVLAQVRAEPAVQHARLALEQYLEATAESFESFVPFG